MPQHSLTIRTLRTAACGESRICPSVHEVKERPDVLFVVSKQVTDPGERAAFAHLLEDGLQVGWMPAGFLPVDSDALLLTSGVTGPGVRQDRQYVISSEVTDAADLAAFDHLMDPDTEQLGTVLTRTLQGV